MKGIKRGMELIAEFGILFLEVVIRQGKVQHVGAFGQVWEQFIADYRGIKWLFGTIPTSSDPFKGSRMAFQALKLKLGQ